MKLYRLRWSLFQSTCSLWNLAFETPCTKFTWDVEIGKHVYHHVIYGGSGGHNQEKRTCGSCGARNKVKWDKCPALFEQIPIENRGLHVGLECSFKLIPYKTINGKLPCFGALKANGCSVSKFLEVGPPNKWEWIPIFLESGANVWINPPLLQRFTFSFFLLATHQISKFSFCHHVHVVMKNPWRMT